LRRASYRYRWDPVSPIAVPVQNAEGYHHARSKSIRESLIGQRYCRSRARFSGSVDKGSATGQYPQCQKWIAARELPPIRWRGCVHADKELGTHSTPSDSYVHCLCGLMRGGFIFVPAPPSQLVFNTISIVGEAATPSSHGGPRQSVNAKASTRRGGVV